MSHETFSVKTNLTIAISPELSVRIGNCILSSGTEDKQILALGHNLIEDYQEVSDVEFPNIEPDYVPKNIIPSKKTAFSINYNVNVSMPPMLSVRVGRCLLNSHTQDKQILSFGHFLFDKFKELSFNEFYDDDDDDLNYNNRSNFNNEDVA